MNLRHRNKTNDLARNLKDYTVPIVALLLVLVFFYSIFSGGNKAKVDSSLENSSGLKVVFDNTTTKASIEYDSGKKSDIETNTNLYKGETLTVKEGSINIKNTNFDLALDKMGILKYKQDGNIFLDSANMWLISKAKADFAMKFLNISASAGSVFNLYQNEVESSIYVLSGSVEISNLSEQSTILSKGEKLSLLSTDASKADIDLSSMKTEIDEYFKTSDWFIKNSGEKYLEETKEKTSTGELDETGSGSITKKKTTGLISFDNLEDESSSSASTIDITGTYNALKVSRISLNGKDSKLDKEGNSFSFTKVPLSKKTNDLIFRIYDENDDLLDKMVYTVYSNINQDDLKEEDAYTKDVIKNSDLDISKFVFTSPSANGVYTTYETQVTIKGQTPAGVVSKVTVNDYKLSSFNGTTWRYHAFTDQATLKQGTNLYEIKYFDKDGSMIYKNQFTIIKK